jgi:hypothetical protein
MMIIAPVVQAGAYFICYADMKTCKRCGIEKPTTEFYRRPERNGAIDV